MWHGLSGFLIYVVAARLLEPAAFGQMSAALALALAVEIALIQGLPKALARALPLVDRHRPHLAEGLIRGFVFRSLGLAGILFFVVWCAGKLLTDYFGADSAGNTSSGGLEAALLAAQVGSPALFGRYLQLAALDILAFSGYVVWLATLNGRMLYKRQALLMACYSTLKTALVIGLLIWRPDPVMGIAGYVGASLLATVVAGLLHIRGFTRIKSGEQSNVGAGIPEIEAGLTDQELAAKLAPVEAAQKTEPGDFENPVAPLLRASMQLALPLAILAVLQALILNLDYVFGWLFFSPEQFGYFAGAIQASRMIYFVFLAMGDALFPGIAEALAQGEQAGDEKAGYGAVTLSGERIRKGLTILLQLALPAVGLAIGFAGPTLRILFGAGYEEAAPALQVLALTSGGLVLFHVFASIVAAEGRPEELIRLLAVILFFIAAVFGVIFSVISESDVPNALLFVWPALVPFWAVLRLVLGGFKLVEERVKAANVDSVALYASVASAYLIVLCGKLFEGLAYRLGWSLFIAGGILYLLAVGVQIAIARRKKTSEAI